MTAQMLGKYMCSEGRMSGYIAPRSAGTDDAEGLVRRVIRGVLTAATAVVTITMTNEKR